MVELILATAEDAKLLHKLQTEAFMPLYEKYHDDETSLVKESLERITCKITEPNSEFYIIRFAGKNVGGIRIRRYEGNIKWKNISWIYPIFVIPDFWNRGIAGEVIQRVFELYPETVIWKLDTIKQEKGNCHLYEKCGFVRVGAEHVVNEQMTLISYERFQFPDYTSCIANLANSILEEFGVGEGRQGLHLLAPYLENDYENIVVILLDGMGNCIIEKNLDEEGFFRSHLAGTYSSVFPPTTVAATTSIANGLSPSEHGWLGWDCYYPQIDKNVSVFLNTETGTDQQAADYNVAWKFCGYESVASKIRKNGGNAFEVSPFWEPFPDSFEKICEQIQSLCKRSGKKYIYSYWDEPDNIMHKKGCYGTEAKQKLRALEEQVRRLCEGLENTLVIVTADHGHMDSGGVAIVDYPNITECLTRLPSIEPRALNLFVKEEKREQFEREFQKEFGVKFLLWTKEQVLEQNIFGLGKEHPNFRGMLGDYLAVAVDDLSIYSTREEAKYFIGVHAGLTRDEMEIPLIVIERG